MLVLKRHYQFWIAILALHKIGAIAIPATYLLQEHDYEYRYNAAGVDAILCTADGDIADRAENGAKNATTLKEKIIVGGKKDGWRDFDEEYKAFPDTYERKSDSPCGSDDMLMYFTSGTTGNPKMALHAYTYPLGHFHTANYWHCVDPEGLHLTISDTGWAKAAWGKIYGQWLCEAALFVYDFDKFKAAELLEMMQGSDNVMILATVTLILQALETCAVPIFAFLLVDAVCLLLFKRKIPEKYQAVVNMVFFVALMGFMLAITFQDVFRLFR